MTYSSNVPNFVVGHVILYFGAMIQCHHHSYSIVDAIGNNNGNNFFNDFPWIFSSQFPTWSICKLFIKYSHMLLSWSWWRKLIDETKFFSWVIVTNNQTGDIKHLAKKPLADNPVCWSPSCQWELRNWDGPVTRAAASGPGAEARLGSVLESETALTLHIPECVYPRHAAQKHAQLQFEHTLCLKITEFYRPSPSIILLSYFIFIFTWTHWRETAFPLGCIPSTMPIDLQHELLRPASLRH